MSTLAERSAMSRVQDLVAEGLEQGLSRAAAEKRAREKMYEEESASEDEGVSSAFSVEGGEG